MAARSPVLLACAATLLAGCVATPAPPPEAGPGAAAADATGPGEAWSLALTRTMTLEPRPAAAGEAARVPLRWAWAEWLAAAPPPTWASMPLEGPVLVTNASVTVHYLAAGAALSAQQRPELTAWWGPDASRVHHAFLDGPDVLLPGQAHQATLELMVPAGGLVVDRGQRIELSLATYYLDGDAVGAVDVLLDGADAATKLDLLVRPLALPAAEPGALVEEDGSLRGGLCMGLGAVSPGAAASHPLEVPAGAAGLRVVLERTGGTGPPDLDFAVLGPEGEVVGRGQGPGPDEELTLREPNLAAAGPGTWTVRVYNCTPQASAYRLSAALLAPAGGAGGA